MPLPTERSTEGGRERILVAAASRFADLGYAETTLRLVASDVDMKAGSIYYHFASKDDLIVEVLRRGIALMMDAFASVEDRFVNEPDESGGRDCLAAHVNAHLRVLHGNFGFTSLHVTAFRTAPAAVRATIVPERDEYEERWTRLLRSILERPSDEEVRILRLVLFGAMNSSVEWFDAERGSIDAFAGVITDQFWYGAAFAEVTSARTGAD